MNSNSIRTFLASMILIAVSSTGENCRAGDPLFVPHQALVRLRPGATIGAFHTRHGTISIDEIPSRSLYLVGLSIEVNEEEFVESLSTDPDVDGADLDYFGEDVNPGPSTQSIFLSVAPFFYDTQPATTLIRADEAMSITTGAGVLVAVIDSGIDPFHPRLAGAIAPGGHNFINGTSDVRDVADGVDSDDDGLFDEMVGHGTLVAGLVLRVAPGARVLPLKVMDSDGVVTTFRMVAAIYRAIDAGAHVINISLGTTSQPAILSSAISEAVAGGVVVVAAAGNDDSIDPRNPAGLSSLGVIAVAATDDDDIRASYSNYGPHVTLVAPGEWVASTTPNNGYGRARGTSFAAPLVSGAAALVLAHCGTTDPLRVKEVILSGAVPVSHLNPSYPGMLGGGRLEIVSALQGNRCVTRCIADIDDGTATGVPDGGVTIDDLLYYVLIFDGGDPAADLDDGSFSGTPDGGVTIDDLLFFLARFDAGC